MIFDGPKENKLDKKHPRVEIPLGGCMTYISCAWLLTIVLVILKLTNTIDLTWIEATMFFWFPFVTLAVGMAIFLTGVLITGVVFLIISSICLIIDWIKKIFGK